MASPIRSARTDVDFRIEDLEVGKYNFYQLVELLCRKADIDPVTTLQLASSEEPIRFLSAAGLGFPARDIIGVKRTDTNKYIFEVSFLGLHGSQSPLPGYYLENLATEYEHKENKLVDFIDFFNHRLILLLYHVWRKYRYYVNFRDEGKDEFSQRLFSLVGLGHRETREKLSIHNSKMLAYAGMLASPGRSPDVICSLVSHCFDLPDITLKEFCFRYVDIQENEQNRLGLYLKEAGEKPKGRSCLGENFTLGNRVPSRDGKFELQLNNLSREKFLTFLPDGENHDSLVTFMSFILKEQLAWELRLGLRSEDAIGIKLGDDKPALLGWTSFIGKPPANPFVTINIRE